MPFDFTKNKEIGKLIEFAYHMNKEGIIDHFFFQNPVFYNDMNYGKETEFGGFLTRLGYPGHGIPSLCTQILIYKSDENNNITFANFWETCNSDYEIWHTKLIQPDKNTLEPDFESEDDIQTEFIESFSLLGFNEEDITKVIYGKITAREAYQNIAPKDKKNYQWLNYGRRFYTFDGNVAVEGDFSSVSLDYFPFPFEEQPILDCSKVKTKGINFGKNKYMAKLINVNKKSIKYADIKTAIIDEVIDLSKVNAYHTTFGHQVLKNIEKSIASIEDMDLSLALDEDGNHFDVTTLEKIIDEQKRVRVYANVDDVTMAENATRNDSEGIGLIRTEEAIDKNNKEVVKKIVEYLLFNNSDGEELIKKLLYNHLKQIIEKTNLNEITVRLICPNLEKLLKISEIEYKKNLYRYQGSNLFLNTNILYPQLDAIMTLAYEYDIDINILIPKCNYSAKEVIDEIKCTAEEYGSKEFKVGSMIEDKNVAIFTENISTLAETSDFIVIGTNDLTESILGIKRNPSIKDFTALNEETKSYIETVIDKARYFNPKIKIGICGEHGNYIENVIYYSNLDINYITCSPCFIKQNKEIMRHSKPREKKLSKKL